jgi:hypothetical protein
MLSGKTQTIRFEQPAGCVIRLDRPDKKAANQRALDIELRIMASSQERFPHLLKRLPHKPHLSAYCIALPFIRRTLEASS